MKRRIMVLLVCAAAVLGGVAVTSCDKVGEIFSNLGLSDEEIVKGLRTALDSSANTSALSASKVDGFLMNELIKIAAPPEVVQLKETLDKVAANPLAVAAFMVATKGQSPKAFLGDKMEDLVKSINRAAEEGSKKAYPILKKAITDMTITDGLRILQGGETSATDYLKEKTYQALVDAFEKPVREVVVNGEVSALWEPVAKKYNLIAPAIKGKSFEGYTFVGPESVNPDLSEYITEQAMTGLFKLVAEEEAAIRKDPMRYASDIIRKVFGSPEAKTALNK